MVYTIFTGLPPCFQLLYSTLGSINLAVNFDRARQSCFYQTVFYQSGSICWTGVWKGTQNIIQNLLHDNRYLRDSDTSASCWTATYEGEDSGPFSLALHSALCWEFQWVYIKKEILRERLQTNIATIRIILITTDVLLVHKELEHENVHSPL